MSTVSRAVERLGQTFRNTLRLQDNRAYLAERKEITIGHLDWLFTKVEELKTPYIEQADLNKFNIKVNIFDPSSEEENAATEWNLFYQPMSSTQLRQFAINTDRHPEDRERLEAYERNVDEPMKYVSRIFCTGDGLQNLFAEYFASRADYYFSGAPRGDIGSSLRSVSKWLPTGYGEIISDSYDFENLFPDPVVSWDIAASYRLRKTHNSCPHVIFVLHHATFGKDEPLRGELLSMFEAMKTRLALPQFKSDIIIPVMIISIIYNQGRIVQAHWNGHEVVICMSHLYNLDTKDTAPYDLLTRYMASDPIGDTKHLDLWLY